MGLARQAVKEKIIINVNNKKFEGMDLHTWIMGTVRKRYMNGKFSQEHIRMIEKLVGKSLDDFSVALVDVTLLRFE